MSVKFFPPEYADKEHSRSSTYAKASADNSVNGQRSTAIVLPFPALRLVDCRALRLQPVLYCPFSYFHHGYKGSVCFSGNTGFHSY
jgi:hypothetical protein